MIIKRPFPPTTRAARSAPLNSPRRAAQAQTANLWDCLSMGQGEGLSRIEGVLSRGESRSRCIVRPPPSILASWVHCVLLEKGVKSILSLALVWEETPAPLVRRRCNIGPPNTPRRSGSFGQPLKDHMCRLRS
jgi:hypothetical protein